LWFPSTLPKAAECLKIRPHSLPFTDYLPDLTKSFLNFVFKVIGRKKERRKRNKIKKKD